MRIAFSTFAARQTTISQSTSLVWRGRRAIFDDGSSCPVMALALGLFEES